MKKKSHISLAGYILQNLASKELNAHRKSFFIGSVLPDCMPSFVTRRHTMEETFTILRKELNKAFNGGPAGRGITAAYCRRLGVITHYIADFFTLPHNAMFQGRIREHCAYEGVLGKTLLEYVDTIQIKTIRHMNGRFQTADQICDFIQGMHRSYLKVIASPRADSRYIVELCFRVVDALLQAVEAKMQFSGA